MKMCRCECDTDTYGQLDANNSPGKQEKERMAKSAHIHASHIQHPIEDSAVPVCATARTRTRCADGHTRSTGNEENVFRLPLSANLTWLWLHCV